MMHDMTSFIGPLSSGAMRAPFTASGKYLRNTQQMRVSGRGAWWWWWWWLEQRVVELGYVDPHDLLAEERDELLDARFEHVHALALLRDNAAPLLLQRS
jgi:hypothetical protein